MRYIINDLAICYSKKGKVLIDGTSNESLSWLWGIIAFIIIWEILWISVWVMGVKQKSKKIALLGSFLSTGFIGMIFVIRQSAFWNQHKAFHDYVCSYGCPTELERRNSEKK